MSLKDDDAKSAETATAPRVTLADLEAAVVAENWFTAGAAANALNQPSNPAMELLTIVVLTIANGFTVVGTSAPASPANFDADKGRLFAKEDAMRKLWPLMGFALRDRLDREAEAELDAEEDAGTRM